jgi:hypothetical protein
MDQSPPCKTNSRPGRKLSWARWSHSTLFQQGLVDFKATWARFNAFTPKDQFWIYSPPEKKKLVHTGFPTRPRSFVSVWCLPFLLHVSSSSILFGNHFYILVTIFTFVYGRASSWYFLFLFRIHVDRFWTPPRILCLVLEFSDIWVHLIHVL